MKSVYGENFAWILYYLRCECSPPALKCVNWNPIFFLACSDIGRNIDLDEIFKTKAEFYFWPYMMDYMMSSGELFVPNRFVCELALPIAVPLLNFDGLGNYHPFWGLLKKIIKLSPRGKNCCEQWMNAQKNDETLSFIKIEKEFYKSFQ